MSWVKPEAYATPYYMPLVKHNAIHSMFTCVFLAFCTKKSKKADV